MRERERDTRRERLPESLPITGALHSRERGGEGDGQTDRHVDTQMIYVMPYIV